MSIKCNQEKIDFSRLNIQLRPSILTLLNLLLPNGKLANQEYVSLNPTRYDKNLGW
jgi:hypothetical protein